MSIEMLKSASFRNKMQKEYTKIGLHVTQTCTHSHMLDQKIIQIGSVLNFIPFCVSHDAVASNHCTKAQLC